MRSKSRILLSSGSTKYWITEVAKAGIGTIIRGGVAMGEPGVGSGSAELWQKFDEAKIDELREEGESRTAFMLRFTLTHPQIDTIIVGTQQLEHLQGNTRTVLRGPLPPDVYLEAKRRLDGVNLTSAEVS